MTFLTFNKFVNEELENFYEESSKHGDFKVPVDIQTDKYEHQSGSFVVKPKMKKYSKLGPVWAIIVGPII